MEITSRRKKVLTTQLIHMPELHASLRGPKFTKEEADSAKKVSKVMTCHVLPPILARSTLKVPPKEVQQHGMY